MKTLISTPKNVINFADAKKSKEQTNQIKSSSPENFLKLREQMRKEMNYNGGTKKSSR